MYQAIVMGRGKRIQADSIRNLVQKLSRENIQVSESELVKHQHRLEAGFPIDIMATRKLTHNELIKKSMRPPYLGNPFRRIEDTKRVNLRITHSPNHNREDDC